MTHLLGQRFRPIVDPHNPQPLLILVNLHSPRLPERHDEPVQCHPPRGVHVDMVFILYILVVHRIGAHPVGLVSRPQEGDELILELAGEVADGCAGFGTNEHHLPEMGLGTGVCLKEAS